MKVVSIVSAAALGSLAAAQGLFNGYQDSHGVYHRGLVKRVAAPVQQRTDSCGRPLRQDWTPNGPYSKHGGKKRGRACPAVAQKVVAPEKVQTSEAPAATPAEKLAEAKSKKTGGQNTKAHKSKGGQNTRTHSPKPKATPSPEPVKKAEVKKAVAPKSSPKPQPKQAAIPEIKKEKKEKPAENDDGTSNNNDSLATVSIQSDSGSSRSKRGLTWTVDNNLAPLFGNAKPSWYLHFQMPVVPEMPSDISFVPTLWGGDAKSIADFEATMAGVSSLPSHMLSFNEPDIDTQANMSPQEAARVFKKYLQPYADKGVKVGAPSIAWDVNWLKSFFDACDGCTVSFLSGHYYVGFVGLQESFKYERRLKENGQTETALLESRVKALHNAFPQYQIWVTEYGATTAGGGNAQDILGFAKKTTAFLEAQSYIDRVAFYGVYKQAPDGYVNQNCAFLDGAGQLTEIGKWWTHG